VIRSDLGVGGFAGHESGPEVRRKLRLLKSEGVEFDRGRLHDGSRVYSF